MQLIFDFYINLIDSFAHTELSIIIIEFCSAVAIWKMFWRLADI